jgi:hypothetical protein
MDHPANIKKRVNKITQTGIPKRWKNEKRPQKARPAELLPIFTRGRANGAIMVEWCEN